MADHESKDVSQETKGDSNVDEPEKSKSIVWSVGDWDFEASNKRRLDAEAAQNDVDDPIFASMDVCKRLKTIPTQKEIISFRKIRIPKNRFAPLKKNWMKIYEPIVKNLKLQIRFNTRTFCVEIRSCPETIDKSHIQKAEDFIKAFVCGFEIEDALVLIRLDNLFIQSFEVNDVKPVSADHLGRAIGRIVGSAGRVKFTIENVTKTRIVIAGAKVHILGAFQNIQVAMKVICELIMGSPPQKVFSQLRKLSMSLSSRF